MTIINGVILGTHNGDLAVWHLAAVARTLLQNGGFPPADLVIVPRQGRVWGEAV